MRNSLVGKTFTSSGNKHFTAKVTAVFPSGDFGGTVPMVAFLEKEANGESRGHQVMSLEAFQVCYPDEVAR